jgi:hypothetical protein
MAAPSNTMTNSLGFTVRTVTIQQIALDPSTGLTTAICVDKASNEVRVPAYTMRAKGQPPEVGELWLIDQFFGFWTLAAYVGPANAGAEILPSPASNASNTPYVPPAPPVIPVVHAGIATLVAGTLVVANTAITAESVVQLTYQAIAGTAGFLSVPVRVAGASFTILSSSTADTSVVAWFFTEPG